METLKFKGLIQEKQIGEGYALHIGQDCLSQDLQYIENKSVSVRFYISESDKSEKELKENLILQISGALYADYGDVYSDYTGYLWTDDKVNIGNHDLINDLWSHEGKYCLLEIDIHK